MTDPTPADASLELVIAVISTQLHLTPDDRLVQLQRLAISLRSEAQIEHMEAVTQLTQKSKARRYG